VFKINLYVFLHIKIKMNSTALTYDDIQLVPKFSTIKSRTKISLRTKLSRNYDLLIPIVGSPMDTVCETDMAVKLFRMGGVGCIHRFNTPEEQAAMIADLKYKIYGENGEGHLWYDWERADNIPIMAAIGVNENDKDRAELLVKSGANVLLIDVAHGDHQNVIDMIKWCKETLPSYVDIIAGNIATAEAAERLQAAGADGLRVGIGGGSMCSTRIKTGFGIPNVTCIENIVKVAKVPVMADGGIRSSGDIAKALALGASNVMLGSLIAGTDESPGEIIETSHGLYKKYRGSASMETKATHGQEIRNIEGESTMISYKGGLKFILNGIIDGVKSALSYAGADRLDFYHPDYVFITNSGINESKPHGL
jgi:IMP dehydrogenase